ncbi:hypothetical protein KKH23_02215 [Patescibacteria group bacterium]|nr:hypothetical protein [Patescibacteria group bacterium]MBU0777369.1 hypothetical protein [Patescibacteria group bacterium]MBU0845997.1 hypothetical protein [Patescibacteria group bacterium]MBU0922546.1 hypothetical protein [Patescibacteria group bacterium]MBU1066521.1 hypothetical protein [Patescibacteria group bacterium]
MRIKEVIRKYWLVVFIVSLLYFLYAFFVLSPHSYKHFSLIDDGQSVHNSYLFDECFNSGECAPLKEILIEKQSGRFRPGYWGIQHILYKVLGINPILHHQFRVYIVGYLLLLLLMASAIQAGGGPLSVILSSGIFVSSFSFSENIIRLGPQEPYQILLIGFFSLIYLSRSGVKRIKSYPRAFTSLLVFMLLAAITVKEPSFVIVFAPLFISFLYIKKESDKKLSVKLAIFVVLFVVAGKLLARPQNETLAYAENFQINFERFFGNGLAYTLHISNMTSPFLKLVGLTFPVVFFSKKLRKEIINEQFLFWVLAFFLSTAILLPWRFVLDRYILVPIFCFSIITGVLFSKIADYLMASIFRWGKTAMYKIIITLVLVIIFTNLFFVGFPVNLAKTINYKNWYSQCLEFGADQVMAISALENETLYINATDSLGTWEVLYEIPLHLKYLYNKDVRTQRLKGDLPNTGYLFTRIPFELAIEEPELIKLNYKIIKSKSYEIKQIDPLVFREKFPLRPIKTLSEPPLKEDSFNYYWEIRQLE